MAKSSSTLPIIAAAAALVVLSDKKKKGTGASVSGNVRWGVRVSSNCKTVEIVNPKLFNQFLFGAFDELVSIDWAR